jgi:hypothetical protein
LDAAAAQSQKFKGKTLYWMEPSTKHCRQCGAPGHEFKDCTNRKPSNPYKPLYDRFKPEPYHPPRNFQTKNSGPFKTFSQITQHNSTPKPDTRKPTNSNPPPQTTIEAIKFIQEKLDSIENKLVLIDDEIVSLKNSALKHEQNQKDIDFRLNRLEYMHYIEHDSKHVEDPNYKFPRHIGDEEMEVEQPDTALPPPIINTDDIEAANALQVPNDPPIIHTDPLNRIDLVETSVSDIKSEIRDISAALRSIIHTFPSSNQ